jgi:beta-N-acetylhexosaminidase
MKYTLDPSPQARALAERLSLRQAANQVCCPLLNFEASEPAFRGALLGGAHISRGTREKIASQTQALRAACESPPLSIPPFCTADLECGPGRAVLGTSEFPDFMGLGANDSEELAYEVGRATALEARSVGLNWTFSPCVDLAELADSPVVSTRSAGRQVERVIRVARGYLRGLQDYGVVATLKHFPGDGHATFDQHLTTVQNPLSRADWWQGPGRVYRELIEAGAKTIMSGHIALPAFDQPDARGLFPPATVSPRLLTDLLRGELGFAGLLVSDAMGMGGVAGFVPPFEAYWRFLEAGGDCVLFARVTERRFYPELERALLEKILSERTLYDRAARILQFKHDQGLLVLGAAGPQPVQAPPPAVDSVAIDSVAIDSAAHASLARRVADGAVTLVRDREGLLPFSLQRSTRVLHVVLASPSYPQYEEQREAYTALTAALGERCLVEELNDPGPHALFERVDQFDLVICSIGAATSWGVSVARLHGPICRNLMEGWMRLGTPVVFVNHIHPFVHLEFDALMDCVINTYRSLPCTGERIVRGLTGEQAFTGKF